ncbi:unnamed protein product, partial [Oncorhynchus mykiss]
MKKSNVLQLHVDAASEHSVGPKKGRSSGAKETVYLGGVPDGVDVPGLPAALPSFHGCVRRAVLNQRPAVLSKPLLLWAHRAVQPCRPLLALLHPVWPVPPGLALLHPVQPCSP